MVTFSEFYLRPDQPQADAMRMRLQLLGLFDRLQFKISTASLAEMLLERSGVRVPTVGGRHNWPRFLTEGELRDLLDWITYVFDLLSDDQSYGDKRATFIFLSRVREIFDKNHAPYTVSDQGHVRFRIDEAHEMARFSALQGLHLPRYRATRVEFEKAYDSLASLDPDGKSAIRAIFGALENQFKLMFDVSRLDVPNIRTNLVPMIKARHADNKSAANAGHRIAEELEK